MKKVLAFVLTAALLTAVFAVSAFAEGGFNELINVLMSTPGVAVTPTKTCTPAEELEGAIEGGADLIPEGCELVPDRITVLQTGTLSCDEEVYDVTFKVWSTLKRTVGLFFLPEDGEEWELVSCNLGDVIEGRFETGGTYTIVVGW